MFPVEKDLELICSQTTETNIVVKPFFLGS